MVFDLRCSLTLNSHFKDSNSNCWMRDLGLQSCIGKLYEGLGGRQFTYHINLCYQTKGQLMETVWEEKAENNMITNGQETWL